MRASIYVDGFNLYYALKRTGPKWLNIANLAIRLLPPGHVINKVRYFTARIGGTIDADAPRRQQIYLNALATIPNFEVHYGRFLAKDHWRPVVNLPIASRDVTHADGTIRFPVGVVTVAADPTDARSIAESLPIDIYPVKGTRKPRRPRPPASNAIKAKVFVFEEKGSDVNLGTHLLNDAWRGSFDVALVITNDSDLAEPVRIVAAELAKTVVVACPPGNRVCGSLAVVATSVLEITPAQLAASVFPDPVTGADGTPIPKPLTW